MEGRSLTGVGVVVGVVVGGGGEGVVVGVVVGGGGEEGGGFA